DVKTLESITGDKRPISYGIVQTGPHVHDGIPCLRVLDIVKGSIKTDNLIRTTQKISNAYKRTQLKENDLVIPLRGKVGEVGIIGKELVKANLTRGIALIALEGEFAPQYIKQALCSESSQNRLISSMNGSALQEISIGTLRSFKISIPKCREEQTAIANALS
ncbi:restriction endonuclease subunit S, partial [Vibrio anguillarum]